MKLNLLVLKCTANVALRRSLFCMSKAIGHQANSSSMMSNWLQDYTRSALTGCTSTQAQRGSLYCLKQKQDASQFRRHIWECTEPDLIVEETVEHCPGSSWQIFPINLFQLLRRSSKSPLNYPLVCGPQGEGVSVCGNFLDNLTLQWVAGRWGWSLIIMLGTQIDHINAGIPCEAREPYF